MNFCQLARDYNAKSEPFFARSSREVILARSCIIGYHSCDVFGLSVVYNYKC